MRYLWDFNKAAANLAKHGVSFEEALEALDDPNRLERVDDRFSYGEERLQTIGRSSSGILFVVTVERQEEQTRIISARQATRPEKDRYREQVDDGW